MKLHRHAAEVSQQLVWVRLLCKYAERALQPLQLTRQLVVLLRKLGKRSCHQPGLERATQVESQSSSQRRVGEAILYIFIRDRTEPAVQHKHSALFLWKVDAKFSEKSNQFDLVDLSLVLSAFIICCIKI